MKFFKVTKFQYGGVRHCKRKRRIFDVYFSNFLWTKFNKIWCAFLQNWVVWSKKETRNFTRNVPNLCRTGKKWFYSKKSSGHFELFQVDINYLWQKSAFQKKVVQEYEYRSRKTSLTQRQTKIKSALVSAVRSIGKNS